MSDLLKIAIDSSILAGIEILKVYEASDVITVEHKADDSPLTIADQASNEIINSHLTATDIPIISEENKQLPYTDRKDWKSCWIVDPLDGTKEFIKKNGEFTVNIALCEHGRPTFGVIYVPVSRELYYADVQNQRAFKTVLNQDHSTSNGFFSKLDAISPAPKTKEIIKVVGSRSHMNQHTLDYIDTIKDSYDQVEIVSKGSSLKFCLVAEGKAHVYPRFAPTMEWDTAAGQAICKAVGLNVISQETQDELMYNKENLLNPYFLVRP